MSPTKRRKTAASAAVPAAVYLDGLSETSRVTLKDALGTIAQFFDSGATYETLRWWELRYDDSQRLRSYLVKRYKARSINKMLAAYRGVLRACWRLKLMSTDDYHHARDVRVMSINEAPAGRRVTIDELRRLVNDTEDKRDAALISLLYAAGLRRFEATGLRIKDYDRRTGQLTVRGKRNKVRQITIHLGWRGPLEAWLDEYEPDGPNAPLFPSRDRKAEPGSPINLRAVSYIIERTQKQLGVAFFTSHDMRRTFITDLIEAGVDLVVVKRLAGHESVNTTASYDRRGREAEDAAIEKLKGL